VLDEVKLKLSPAAPALQGHRALYLLAFMRSSVPRNDLAGRPSTARALMDAVRFYELGDLHPRDLFDLQGSLAFDIARVAADALDEAPQEQPALARALGRDGASAQPAVAEFLKETIDLNLAAAQVAFENAAATTVPASPFEPVADVEVPGLLGDHGLPRRSG
jgi:hypothetical protein